MKKLRSIPTRVSASVLLAVFLVASSAYSFAQSSTMSPQSPSLPQGSAKPDRRTTVNAIREGGLRAAAKLHGTYVVRQYSWGWGQFDIESLVKHSKLIVSGTPLSSVCNLSKDGSYITTDYQFRVEDVLKEQGPLNDSGATMPGDADPRTITVKLVGGYIKFEDGTAAVLLTPGFKKMEPGKKYILFLIEGDTANPGDLVLTGGPQGLFEIDADSTITPHALATDLGSKYKGMRTEDFLQQVREAIWETKGQTQECCEE